MERWCILDFLAVIGSFFGAPGALEGGTAVLAVVVPGVGMNELPVELDGAYVDCEGAWDGAWDGGADWLSEGPSPRFILSRLRSMPCSYPNSWAFCLAFLRKSISIFTYFIFRRADGRWRESEGLKTKGKGPHLYKDFW